ncbi:YitT family protein [Filibacter tadaridae]|uniref:5xTM membrane BCR, YitT family n=1 Tax=Filibacter tadaridae TaxID=2483811 RepID=A0A3P5XT04_9BACL|nr:YitT family protein [Filibacter tadaridae]VDC33509.1 hypothetical protein FILTAD_02919 [Filibacter tadaridae]
MQFLEKSLTILIGSLLIAIGVNLFLVPFGLLEGGAVGVSLIFHYMLDVKVGLTFLLLSIPIFIMAWFFYRSFFYNGIHGMLFSSLIIDLLYPLHKLGGGLGVSPLFGAAFGGIIIGAGAGIMLRRDISIGGIDLFSQMIARKLRMNAGIAIFLVDVVIVTIGSLMLESVFLSISLTTVLLSGITTSIIVSTAPELSKELTH